MKHRVLPAGLVMFGCLAGATPPPTLPPALLFSSLQPGEQIVAPLRIISLPRIPANQFELIEDGGKTVLQVTSRASAATVAIPLTAAAATPLTSSMSPASATHIAWRWKIDRVLATADMEQKSGDDFAARLYVFFDAPMSNLPFLERTKIRLIRLIWGETVPTAALCYVWDNTHPVGYSQPSPYSNQVRVIVLQSGAAQAGTWIQESRNVSDDFKRAFGFDSPRITGVAVGSDTDQTREGVRTWFGDVVLQAISP